MTSVQDTGNKSEEETIVEEDLQIEKNVKINDMKIDKCTEIVKP